MLFVFLLVCVLFRVLLALEGLVVSLCGPLGSQALVLFSYLIRSPPSRGGIRQPWLRSPPPHSSWFLWFSLAASGSPSVLPVVCLLSLS